MKIKIEYFVESCKECPHSSNSTQEHDDPFTSAPHPTIWYCNQGKNTRMMVYIPDANKIAFDCPMAEEELK